MRSSALDEKRPCERPSGFEFAVCPGVLCCAPRLRAIFVARRQWTKKEVLERAPTLLLGDFSVGGQSIQPVLGRRRFLPIAVVLDEATQNLCGLFVVPCSCERLGEQ
jgi:hypothetical protein